MPNLSLEQLINIYSGDIGEIELHCEFAAQPNPTLKKWALHELNGLTLFKGYKEFLQTKDANEKEYFEFFRDLVRKGTPVETMVCAAAFLENESKEVNRTLIDKTCKDWGTNIHFALYYATLKFLTNKSHIAPDWYAIILSLLSIGADPNYAVTKYKNILAIYKWTLPIEEINSAFTLTVSQPEVTETILKLANDFALQQEKLHTKMHITSNQAMRIFPKVQPRALLSFISGSWFKWLEKNYPASVKEYLKENINSFFSALAANKDFESIEYFRVNYEMDPFPILIEKEEKGIAWPETASFQYLEIKLTDRLKNYITHNQEKLIDRFLIDDIAAANKFPKIDNYRERYNIDPFILLKKNNQQWPHSPIFRYLEARNFDNLKNYIKANNEQIIERFSIEQLVKHNQFDTIDQLKERYGIEPHFSLIKLFRSNWNLNTPLFSYLERTYPNDTCNLIRSDCNHTLLCNTFLNNNDVHSLKILNRYKAIPVAMIFDRIDEKQHKDYRENTLFQFLEECSPAGMTEYFRHPDHFDKKKELLNDSNFLIHMANKHDVDVLKYWNLNEVESSGVNPYYQKRCQWILNFIFNQQYPKTMKRYIDGKKRTKTACEVSHMGKKIVVSSDMYQIIESLQKAMTTPKESTNYYSYIAKNIAPKLASAPSSDRDEAEQQIYTALTSFLCDDSPLSRYVRREPNIYRDCIPLLTGLRSKGSVIEKISKDPLFERKLFGSIFRFMGDYGIKDEDEAWRLKEAKLHSHDEDEKQSPEFVKWHNRSGL